MTDLSKCTEIISQSNFVLLRNVDENAVEKNLEGFSPNTRILKKRQKLAFFGVAKRWRIEFKNKCHEAFNFLKTIWRLGAAILHSV